MASETAYIPDRRPIAARGNPLAQRVSRWLAAQGVTANSISICGMVAGMIAGIALFDTIWPAWERWLFLLAACLIQLRLLANLLDGMVAMETRTASPVGELYNEIPDRVSDACILVGAGYATGSSPELGWIAACVALFVAYVRAQGKAAGAPNEYCGPMAKQQRMATITLAALYASLAPTALQLEHSLTPGWGVMAWALALVVAGGALTAVRRLGRIAHALRNRSGAVR